MVAMTCANQQAVRSQGSCILFPNSKLRRSIQEIDSSSETVLTIMDILDSESLFDSFERHLKREFSLENLNFIVAVVHYRRLCEERTHNSHSTSGMLGRGKNTCRKMQDISMQPFGDAFNLVPLIPTCGGNIIKHRNKRTPRLSWIESEVELCADKENTALFIFDEYCDRGAPQEINLNRRERNELVEFFSHSIKDPYKLNTIFDSAFESILDLLENDSLKRFRIHSSLVR